jgi:hypothetical protein
MEDVVLAIRVYGTPDGLVEFADNREAPAMERAGWERVRPAPPLKVALRPPPMYVRPDTLTVSGRFLFLRGRLAETALRHLAEVPVVLAYTWNAAERWRRIHGPMAPSAALGLPEDPHVLFALPLEGAAAPAQVAVLG